MIYEYISCILAVSVEGTFMHTSQYCFIFPPLSPVNPITFIPFTFATLIAWTTFLEFPEVEITNNISP